MSPKLHTCIGLDDLLEDLDIAYNQAVHVSMLDVIPLPNGLDQQVEYMPVSEYRLEIRVLFEECIKASCQSRFKAFRNVNLKRLWIDLAEEDDRYGPIFHSRCWAWRRIFMETHLFECMTGSAPCINDISPITFKDACLACGCFTN
jgi:hypothetical protein